MRRVLEFTFMTNGDLISCLRTLKITHQPPRGKGPGCCRRLSPPASHSVLSTSYPERSGHNHKHVCMRGFYVTTLKNPGLGNSWLVLTETLLASKKDSNLILCSAAVDRHLPLSERVFLLTPGILHARRTVKSGSGLTFFLSTFLCEDQPTQLALLFKLTT